MFPFNIVNKNIKPDIQRESFTHCDSSISAELGGEGTNQNRFKNLNKVAYIFKVFRNINISPSHFANSSRLECLKII